MPPDTETKPKRQTWLDVMPAGMPLPELLSHDDLLEELNRRGIELSSSALEYYRNLNILPRPIRRRHEGRTQPVYPLWYIHAIEYLKQMQAENKSLDEIRHAIKPRLKTWALSGVHWHHPVLDQAEADLDAALREYAKTYMEQGELRGRNINMIRVTLFDDDGEPIDYHDTGPD